MSDQNEKILDKIKKLHLKAESCKEIGSDLEAQAFAEMVTRLLNDHKLEMSDIQFEEQRKTQPVDSSTVIWENHDMQTKRTRIAWIEHLASIAARAYSCRIMVIMGSSRFVLAGTQSNREIAEYVIVTLVRSAEKIADEAYVKHFYECRDKGDVAMARGYRAAFLDGFVDRISARFAEERKRADSNCTALVRFDQEKADLDAFMKINSKTIKGAGLQRHSRGNSAGYKAGADKAESMDIGGKAVKTGRDQKVIA